MAFSDSSTSLLSGYHHARYFREDVPLHVISRTIQGFGLLVPRGDLNKIIVGVVARALTNYSSVRIYALVVLSNHIHAMVRGKPGEVSNFIGFVKREISRRWGPKVNWQGTMWDEYESSALPTAASQVNCLRYILSQGVKEGLVARPEQWPGVHCAHSLMTGEPLRGIWLDGTSYGRRLDKAKRAKNPRPVDRADYEQDSEFSFETIPAWDGCDENECRRRVRALVEEIVIEGQRLRGGKRPLGKRKILRCSTRKSWPISRPPWFEQRRRMICWASTAEPAVRDYLDHYWAFQRAFRAASDAYLAGDANAEFPLGAFRPMGIVRPPTPPLLLSPPPLVN